MGDSFSLETCLAAHALGSSEAARFLATVAAAEPLLVIIAAAVSASEPPLVLLPATVAVVLAFIVPVGSSGATATAAPLPPSSPELVLLQLRRSFHEELL